jgi:hypothetical protein
VIAAAVFWLRDPVSAVFAFLGWIIVLVRHAPNLREMFRNA